MKVVSFFDAILGDGKRAYLPLDTSLNHKAAQNIMENLREVSPGFALSLHFGEAPIPSQRRWWLVIEREQISESIHG